MSTIVITVRQSWLSKLNQALPLAQEGSFYNADDIFCWRVPPTQQWAYSNYMRLPEFVLEALLLVNLNFHWLSDEIDSDDEEEELTSSRSSKLMASPNGGISTAISNCGMWIFNSLDLWAW